MFSAVINNPAEPLRSANPLNTTAAVGAVLGLGVLGLGGWALARYYRTRALPGLIPGSVPQTGIPKASLMVRVAQDLSRVWIEPGQGAQQAGFSIFENEAQLMRDQPLDIVVSLPNGVSGIPESTGSLVLVAQTQRDFVFRWQGGVNAQGQGQIQLVGPAVQPTMGPMPLGQIRLMLASNTMSQPVA